MEKGIIIKGARQNNLKNIDLTLPRNQLIVFTGLSGSGKSSLAFDTIYAEGQRKYVESLSAYARQFLGQMNKPDVDKISGLSPAISIDQKSTSHNPRSTVGTVTEIHDYLRMLYAHTTSMVLGRSLSRRRGRIRSSWKSSARRAMSASAWMGTSSPYPMTSSLRKTRSIPSKWWWIVSS